MARKILLSSISKEKSCPQVKQRQSLIKTIMFYFLYGNLLDMWGVLEYVKMIQEVSRMQSYTDT